MKWIRKILSVLLVVFLFGVAVQIVTGEGCKVNEPPANTEPTDKPTEPPVEEKPPAGEDEDPATYTVNYVMLAEKKLQAIPTFLYQDEGAYPKSYVEGETLTVDDLHGKMNKVTVNWGTGNPFEDETEEKPITMWAGSGVMDPNNPNKDYLVYGWYLDPDCTIEFVNGVKYMCNLTLYAKVSVGYWSGWY